MLDIETVDFMSYCQSLSIASKHAKTVASLLVNVAPADLGDAARTALMRAVAKADVVEEIRGARARSAPSLVDPMRDVVRSMGALSGALTHVASIPANRSGRGTRAAAIQRALFPTGTGFLRGDAAILWQDARLRMRWIEEQSLGEAIVQVLGGPELLDAVRDATTALGDALGVGNTPRPVPSRDALQSARRSFLRAVKAYGRVLAATVDEDEPRTIQRYLDAVAPLDAYRITRGPSDEDETLVDDVEPITPSDPATPPVPPVG